jgi:outer membrane protein assembly factor BamB
VASTTYASPALGPDGTLYMAGTTDLKAISPQGVILWSFATGNTVYSSPAIAPDGTIYFGSMDTKVYALDPNTHLVKNGWPFVTGGYVASSPAIGRDGTVFVGSQDGKLYALNPNGTQKWSLPLSGYVVDSSPAIGPDGTVYVGSQDNNVYSINPNTGQINPGWPYATGYMVRSSPAVASDGTIFVGSYDNGVYALNPDGTSFAHSWPFYTGGYVFSSPAIGPDGTVYIGSSDGKLYALAGVSGLARSSWPMFRQNPWHTGPPATLTLSSGNRQPDNSFRFQINGLSGMSCKVEASENLQSWFNLTAGGLVTLTSGTLTFNDPQASGYAYRFYRVSSGPILSYNSLGYVAVVAPVGSSMIANQLDNPSGNTLGVLLTSVPAGTVFSKYNEATQQYVDNTYAAGSGWSDPSMTLNPGEGGFIRLATAQTLSFVGSLRQGSLANPFPTGYSIRSSMVPQTGPIDTSLGFNPVNGDSVLRWNNARAAYDTYSYDLGLGNGWLTGPPVPAVGESVFIYDSTASRIWNRNFTVW